MTTTIGGGGDGCAGFLHPAAVSRATAAAVGNAQPDRLFVRMPPGFLLVDLVVFFIRRFEIGTEGMSWLGSGLSHLLHAVQVQ
jgi:hypothetical protein